MGVKFDPAPVVDDVYGSVSEEMIFKVSCRYLISTPFVMEIIESVSKFQYICTCILHFKDSGILDACTLL